jgi:hypothetical protein
MIKTLLTISIIFLSLTTQAQTTFEKVYSDSGITSAYDIITTFDGGYAITGFKTCSTLFCLDFCLLKLDSLGNQEWVRIYDAYGADDNAYAIVQTKDSGFVMAGVSQTPPNLASNVRLLKVDKNGNKLWDRNYGGLGEQFGFDVEQTFDGGFILATLQDTSGVSNGNQVELIKTDSSGIIEWQKQYYNVGDGQAQAVKQTSDSGYVVTGVVVNMLSPTSGEDIFLLKTDKNGDTLWTKFYGNQGSERGEDVMVASDGNFVIAGHTQGFFNSNQIAAYIIKTNPMGDTLWTKVVENGDQNGVYSVIEDVNKNYVFTGVTSISLPPFSDFYLLKMDSSGNKIFEKQFQYQANANDDAQAITLAKDGGYAMCGKTASTGLTQVYIVKTDTNGLITGIENIQPKALTTFNVYPNPFHSSTTIDLTEIYEYGSSNLSIELYDFTGKLLMQQPVNEAKTILYNQEYANGMYLLTIKNNHQLIATKKLVVNK